MDIIATFALTERTMQISTLMISCEVCRQIVFMHIPITIPIFSREQKLGDIMEMAFAGRYVLLMMALFSIYCGLIYNEFFSVPFHIFGPSAYKCRDPSCSDASKDGMIKYREPYPFGIDPMWRGSRT